MTSTGFAPIHLGVAEKEHLAIGKLLIDLSWCNGSTSGFGPDGFSSNLDERASPYSSVGRATDF